jgi:hypothetical protein
MLHGVRDVDFVAVDAGLFETLIQKLACGTDEGLAFDVFAVSGLFADEDQSGARFAFSKNGLRGVLIQRAAFAVGRRFSERIQIAPSGKEFSGRVFRDGGGPSWRRA